MKLFSGIFFANLIALSFVVTAFFLPPAFSKTERPTARQAIHGEWAVKMEKSLGEVLPIYEPSRAAWGRAEYAFFGEGRKGVVVGADGWLFTDEEFACPAGFGAHMKDNLTFISNVAGRFARQNTKLAVVLVPAKVRVYADHLGSQAVPSCRHNVYSDTLHYLQGHGIPAVDLLPAMSAEAKNKPLYLKTDTHWTPDGARLAAYQTAETVKGISRLSLDKKDFTNNSGDAMEHDGDLMRYIPGVSAPDITPDSIKKFVTIAKSEKASDADLFGNATPTTVLVGTSYSANSLWNFEGFLKESLQTDLLNMADEGQGPFTVMEKYLKSQSYKDNPPGLVIWEIPERYVPAPAHLKGGKAIL